MPAPARSQALTRLRHSLSLKGSRVPNGNWILQAVDFAPSPPSQCMPQVPPHPILTPPRRTGASWKGPHRSILDDRPTPEPGGGGTGSGAGGSPLPEAPPVSGGSPSGSPDGRSGGFSTAAGLPPPLRDSLTAPATGPTSESERFEDGARSELSSSDEVDEVPLSPARCRPGSTTPPVLPSNRDLAVDRLLLQSPEASQQKTPNRHIQRDSATQTKMCGVVSRCNIEPVDP